MITAVILTYNEEQHLARCIESILPVAERILIIDSFSTDRTVEIAESLGAEVIQNRFVNHAIQFQWGLDQIAITSPWTLRIDADEILEPGLQQAIRDFTDAPGEVNAVYLRRKITFLGSPITHGFFYPGLILRLWRTGQGRMEQRWMDEHIVVENAKATRLEGGDLVDDNLNDLAWWTAKHVGYAKREAYEIIASRERTRHADTFQLSGQAKRKRFLKEKIYGRLPASLRGGMYFFYRYILGRGFLDGRAGFFFHFLQAYWYRSYVDATLYELELKAAAEGISPYDYLKRQGIYGK